MKIVVSSLTFGPALGSEHLHNCTPCCAKKEILEQCECNPMRVTSEREWKVSCRLGLSGERLISYLYSCCTFIQGFFPHFRLFLKARVGCRGCVGRGRGRAGTGKCICLVSQFFRARSKWPIAERPHELSCAERREDSTSDEEAELRVIHGQRSGKEKKKTYSNYRNKATTAAATCVHRVTGAIRSNH